MATEQTWMDPDRLDRTSWGSGPWDGEPDKIAWTDPDTGLPCMMVRGPLGSWCGYVAVEPGHPWHGRDFDAVGVDVQPHGGLTYAKSCREELPVQRAVRHVPEPGRPADVWWFGFDCAHLGDLVPAMPPPLRLRSERFPEYRQIYKTAGYVRDEVTSLARQLAAAGREA